MTSRVELVRRAIAEAVVFAATPVLLYYAYSYWNSSRSSPGKVKNVSRVAERLKKAGIRLTEHEETMAAEVIHPSDINVKFSDIGGLDPIIQSLRESVIYPLLYPLSFSGPSEDSSKPSLFTAPKGVLLHGPPGCGKTLLARALAKESNATFINVPFSSLTNKWYGESNKLVAALFSLAKKLEPTIIFIDEIDCFLRERGGGDHEVTGMLKAEFMTMWDGLLTANDRIIVLGATNRPLDIDPAILRRMPKRFAISKPDLEQRTRILQLMLPSSFPPEDIRTIASRTAGLSGSDLKEICREAAMLPLREYMHARAAADAVLEENPGKLTPEDTTKIRPLELRDFFSSETKHSPLAPRVEESDGGVAGLD